MQNRRLTYVGIVVLLAAVLLKKSVFIVNEKEQVVITEFGKPVGEGISKPGLYFKKPFIHTANFFEKRYMEWDGEPDQIPTKGKKYVFVDTYARWQITDPLQFFKRLKNERGAQSRLDDILDGETRDFIANHYIEETVRNSNRKPVTSEIAAEAVADTLTTITVGREKIQRMILESANNQARELGVEILDFRFKRINYIKEVQTQVYERMKSERFRIADKFRSEGQGEASRINGEKERELKKIQSEAFKQAEEIRGKADAQAAAIYAKSYNKTTQSRQLYSFLKSMETLQKTSDSTTSIVISANSDLYKYLMKAQ